MNTRSIEIIAVTSGKGGTGKTLVSGCLGFALTRAGHRVLMVDADLATDGLSLYLLGPQGVREWESFRDEETFAHALRRRTTPGGYRVTPRQINRTTADEQDVFYDALISSRGLYGDLPPPNTADREHFRAAVSQLFEELRSRNEYDYVIVDTRGGFSFETGDVCALADSFILVTEADFTSFHQSRNLVQEISASAEEMHREPRLRSVFVNKALERTRDSGELDLADMEVSFRLELVKEFEPTGLKFEDTHPVPLDVQVLMAYKEQRAPLLHRPAYRFSFAMLSAFAQILRLVTSPWTKEQVKRWNELVDRVSEDIATANRIERERLEADERRTVEMTSLRGEVRRLGTELGQAQVTLTETRARYDRELERTQALIQQLSPAESVYAEAARSYTQQARPRASLIRRIVSAVIWVAGVIGIGTLLLIVVSGIVVAMLRPTLNSTVGQALATPTVDQNRTVLETQVAVLLTQRPVLVDTPTAAVANAPVTATPDAYPGVVASQVPVASPGASPVPSPAALPAFQSTPAAAPQRQSAP